MMREKLVRNHVILVCITVFLMAMPFSWILLHPVLTTLDNIWADTVRYTVTALLTIILMRFFWKKNMFSYACPHFFKSLFTFGSLGIIGAAGAFVFSQDTIDTSPMISTVIGCVLLNFAIAVSEEFLFRGVILNAMLQAWKGKKHYVSASVLAACVIFGLRHLLNLFVTPASLFATCAQVVFTFMAGTYLCAVYLRSQNIWICILIHFCEDFSTSIWGLFSSNAAASASADISIMAALGMIAMQIPYLVFAWLMLRDKKWVLQ